MLTIQNTPEASGRNPSPFPASVQKPLALRIPQECVFDGRARECPLFPLICQEGPGR